MGERVLDPKLKALYDSGAELYSISKLNSLNTCAYAAWKKYINKEKESSNCWSITGGRMHDCLEAIVMGKEDESCLDKAVTDELENLELMNLQFPLDRNGNPTIKMNWEKNMRGFAKHFIAPTGNFDTEQLLLYNVRDNVWIQGYADVIKHNEDGTIEVWDWKSSSKFQKEHRVEASRQLILYAIILESQGFKVSKLQWVMMKYYQATWKLKNGKDKVKVGEWRSLVSDLSGLIEKKLVEAGYDDLEIDIIISECKMNNDLKSVPHEIMDDIKIKVFEDSCDFSDENKKETLDYINNQIDLFQSLGTDEKNWKAKDLSPEGAKQNSFWCSSLCGFGRDGKCKYWIDYCDSFSKKEDEEDLF